jgi:hypothetical protein
MFSHVLPPNKSFPPTFFRPGGSIPVGRNHAMLPADAWRVKPLDFEEIEHMVDTAMLVHVRNCKSQSAT